MDDNLEGRIIEFVVDETGVKRNRVNLSSTLSDDIGMDGDDAVEFFRALTSKFQVDLEALWDHWDQHFYPEGTSLGGLGALIAIGAAVMLGDLSHRLIPLIPYWLHAAVLAFVFLLIYFKIVAEPHPQNEKIAITVQDLIDAAKAGKWTRTYEHEPAMLFRNLT